MKKKNLLITICVTVAVISTTLSVLNKKADIPLVSILSYGPIPPMETSIKGIKKELANLGFIEGKNIRYEDADICFDHALIPQTIANLKSHNPKVMIVTATPIAQFAKGKISDIPIVYNTITNPVDAGLIKEKDKSNENITGSSDMQDLGSFLKFAKSILPHATTIGILYATSDTNDVALIDMMKSAASAAGMSVLAIPVDQVRDIPVRIQQLKRKADFIYVGASSLQSALSTISAEAQKMNIPMFNMEEQAVHDGLVLASFGVNYEAVGRNAGKLVAKLLNGSDIKTLTPIYPRPQDHKGFINRKQAEYYKINIPKNAEIVG